MVDLEVKSNIGISALVCTYNGQDYIQELLASIITHHKDCFIIISDDNSTDSTLSKCVETFTQYGVTEYKIIKNENRGVTRNFIEALQYVKGEYLFLCDQDDLWIPRRVEIYREFFESSSIPHLIFSDATVIDARGQKLDESFIRSSGIDVSVLEDDSILMLNCVQGATCCLNIALINKIYEVLELFSIDDVVIHDWFIAIIAKYFGKIDFIDKPTIEYRQHENNVIGAQKKPLRSLFFACINNPRNVLGKIYSASNQHLLIKTIFDSKKKFTYKNVPRVKRLIIMIWSFFIRGK